MDPIDGSHALRIGKRNVIGSNAHDGAILLVDPDVVQMHMLIPDGSEFPQVAEARQKGSRDISKALSVSDHCHICKQNTQDSGPRMKSCPIPQGRNADAEIGNIADDGGNRVSPHSFGIGLTEYHVSVLMS